MSYFSFFAISCCLYGTNASGNVNVTCATTVRSLNSSAHSWQTDFLLQFGAVFDLFSVSRGIRVVDENKMSVVWIERRTKVSWRRPSSYGCEWSFFVLADAVVRNVFDVVGTREAASWLALDWLHVEHWFNTHVIRWSHFLMIWGIIKKNRLNTQD